MDQESPIKFYVNVNNVLSLNAYYFKYNLHHCTTSVLHIPLMHTGLKRSLLRPMSQTVLHLDNYQTYRLWTIYR